MTSKQRADLLVVSRGLAPSRHKAQAMILAGEVYSGGKKVQKAGELLPEDGELLLREDPCPYVSRGGLKLAGAVESLGLEVSGLECLDVGASTGGFTDCLLRKGAARVIALDVGRHQLHEKLRNDPRVHVIEGYNARHLQSSDLPFRPALVVVDASFISLRIILPRIREQLPGARVLALVKPQFEAGRGKVGRGGVVRDEKVKAEVLENIREFVSSLGYEVEGEVKSPIKGPKGNEEFFIYLA